MTNPDYRHMFVIVDRSGSMEAIREATQEGVNGFFAAQAQVEGYATASLYEFDHEFDAVFTRTPLALVPGYTLVPRGNTALLHAIGTAFTREGAWLASLPEHERPSKVVGVISTDGGENCPRDWTLPAVRDLVTRQREVYSWEVLFLGANIDAVQVAGSYGIPANSSITYMATPRGTAAAFASATASVATSSYAFTDADRAAQAAAGTAQPSSPATP